MKLKIALGVLITASVMWSCKNDSDKTEPSNEELVEMTNDKFEYKVEQFADIKILRYQIPGWENLKLKEQN